MSNLTRPTSPITPDSSLIERGVNYGLVEKLTDRLETSSLDDRSYRVIKLSNRLEVLLVHDAKTDKASAAMDVNVGNYSDPEDLPGMAHAVQRLLCMGTNKYPVENDYRRYLASHSGSSNGHTGATSTNYHFEVAVRSGENVDSNDSIFYGALDRFAQFFIDPQFPESTFDRALKAADSENNLQSDSRRLQQLDKSLSNPRHPYCRFATGILEVLKTQPESRGINFRERVMEFFATNYSANLMKLVILGREPLDKLESWAADLFAGVRNIDLPQNRWQDEQPYGPEQLLTQCFAKPIMEFRTLTILFPFIDQELLFESQPGRYLAHLIGHEGGGSITAYIKSKGWADDALYAWVSPTCPGSPDIFNCQICLTEDGLKSYTEVVKVLFQYIALLKDIPPQKWIFDERKCLADIDFQYKQKTPASKFTSKISAVMQAPLPREWLLSGRSKFRKFDEKSISAGLNCLRADNFRMQISSQTFAGGWDSKEKWYGTEYKYEKIPADFLEDIKKAATSKKGERFPELHLPDVNEFIPTRLEVERKEVKIPATSPQLIRSDDLVRLWYKKDDAFWVPRVDVYTTFRNPLPMATTENFLKARIYTDLVNDAMKEDFYNGRLAGNRYHISSDSTGLKFNFHTYNDTLLVSLEKVLTIMKDLEVKQDRFEIIKKRTETLLKIWDFQQPYDQVDNCTRYLSREPNDSIEQYLAELPHITVDDIQQFYPHLLRQMHIETLVHGNVYKEDALKLAHLTESILKPRVLPQTQWPIRRSLVFPPGANFVYHKTLKNPVNVNHCIGYVLFVGEKAERSQRAKTLLLEQMTSEPAFDQLTIEEQLGDVFSELSTEIGTSTYTFTIQSEKSPQYLEKQINSFLVGYSGTLKNMSDSEFEGHKRSLITQRLEALDSLDQESDRLWSHIKSEEFDFELVHHDATYIEALTKEDMIQFYNEFILPSSPRRSKLSIHLIAQGTSLPEAKPDERTISMNNEGHKDVEDGEAIAVKAEGNGTTPFVITDVRQFKGMLQVTAGPQPVKPISEFKEL